MGITLCTCVKSDLTPKLCHVLGKAADGKCLIFS